MAHTALTDWGCIDLSPAESHTETGYLQADALPARVHMHDSQNNRWTVADASTAAHKMFALGVLGYKKRYRYTANTGFIQIDDTTGWDISCPEDKMAPIHTSGFLVTLCDDDATIRDIGTWFGLSANAGAVCVLARENAVTGGTTTATALIATPVCTVAAVTADDDVLGVFGWGANFTGRAWPGGI